MTTDQPSTPQRKAAHAPPRGADRTADAATRSSTLRSRFGRDQEDAETVAATPPPGAATPPPVSYTAPTGRGAASSTTRTPPGRVRRTYYLARDTAEALDAAVDEIRKGFGGRIDRHEILTALITAGLDRRDGVVTEIRARLLQDLGGR